MSAMVSASNGATGQAKGTQMTETTTLDAVKAAVVEATGIQARSGSIDGTTGLLGSMPEFDSLALVEVLAMIEERFGFEVDAADVTAEVFATVGSLSEYVSSHRPPAD